MRLVRWSPLIAGAALALSAYPAVARVKPSDAAATHAYLEAKIAEEKALMAAIPAGIKLLEDLAVQVKAECPGVLAGAPPLTKGKPGNQPQVEISRELLFGVLLAPGRAEQPVLARFERIVRRLHWSNPKLTRLLHSFAIEEADQSALPAPNLCADLRAWVASGYTAVSTGTKQYLHRLDVVASITVIEPEELNEEPTFEDDRLIAYRLKRYEDRADQVLARRLLKGQAKVTDPRIRPIFDAAGKVFAVLGASATPEQVLARPAIG
jgi:hypothetical protein